MSQPEAGFEPLDISGFAPPAPRDLGAVSQLQWVALADLVIDRGYQRDLTPESRKRIAAIAANFDWSCFTPVIAAAVEGWGFALIDGQHRAHAALLVGVKKVPAMVVVADRERQARSFAAINGNVTRMHVRAVYRAALAAGDAQTVAVDAIARECGVRILTYPRTTVRMNPGDCGSPGEIVALFGRYGADGLRAALTAAMASRGDKRGLLVGNYLRGLALLLRDKPLGLDTIRRAFAHIDLREAMATAKKNGFASPVEDFRDEIARRLARLAAAKA